MLATKNLTYRQNRKALAAILDENRPPVARFRLISTGFAPNHCLSDAGEIVGQNACIACGNCVDVCPVVLREAGAVTLQTQCTSMYLETLVDNGCTRCYSCIRSCPQVDRPLKDFAARHRMVEKIAHWWMVTAYLTLAPTGIALNHFRGEWSDSFILLVGLVHRIAALMFVLSPLVFWRFNPVHFKRTISSIVQWGRNDWYWFKNAWKIIFQGRKDLELFQGEYSTGQKVWYWVVLGGMTVLGLTGIIKWNALTPAQNGLVDAATWVHAGTALAMDLLLLLHIYRKWIGRSLKRAWFIFHPGVTMAEEQSNLTAPSQEWQPSIPSSGTSVYR